MIMHDFVRTSKIVDAEDFWTFQQKRLCMPWQLYVGPFMQEFKDYRT